VFLDGWASAGCPDQNQSSIQACSSPGQICTGPDCVHHCLFFSLPLRVRARALSLSLVATTRRSPRLPTPGAEVFVGPYAGDEHPPGMPIPYFPFLLCETEHINPNLIYLAICIPIRGANYKRVLRFLFFFQNWSGLHVYNHVLYWVRS
jgi:hypothetical protein